METNIRNGVYGQGQDPLTQDRLRQQGGIGSFESGHLQRPTGIDQGSYGQSGYEGSHTGREHRSSESMGRPGTQESQWQHRGGWQRDVFTVRDIMTTNVKVVNPQANLRDIAQIMKDENVGVVPVVDEERRLLGVITDRDLVVRALTQSRSPLEVRARDVMSTDIEAVTPDEEVRDVLDLMADRQVRRIPVVDRDDHLLGLVSISDIATRADFDEDLQHAFQRISSRRSFWNRLWS